MYSTADTDTWITGIWSYFIYAGFNMHTPHHLFPTADLVILPKILKIVD
jgi:fatty acid desaturase